MCLCQKHPSNLHKQASTINQSEWQTNREISWKKAPTTARNKWHHIVATILAKYCQQNKCITKIVATNNLVDCCVYQLHLRGECKLDQSNQNDIQASTDSAIVMKPHLADRPHPETHCARLQHHELRKIHVHTCSGSASYPSSKNKVWRSMQTLALEALQPCDHPRTIHANNPHHAISISTHTKTLKQNALETWNNNIHQK